ncbi:DUF2955 domain-containing protein [Methylobacterium sp. Leaf117]|uniref:DUF2955 domain-containing protein n=1 Tax=Methylobacterium sp. Leaf117 TaxID=1736260 RepID=UPI0006F2DCF8|nr:DUF2955 domain-containing protein [Methylobacterium sp. Leaf117]KQP90762.1 hypothetical protein ASF57_23435 [Methylobacterium sp. Leaf117]
MSTDLTSEREPTRARRAALRLAFGVTACFALVEAVGWDATFLAPLLTAQVLTKLRQPPSLSQGLALVLLIGLSTGFVLAITKSLLSHPAALILTLALLLYLSFYAHLRGAPNLVTLLLQISVVSLPVLAVASPDAAVEFAGVLVSAGFVAVLTAWVAFAVFPGDATDTAPQASAGASNVPSPPQAAREALLNTLVLMPVLTGFVLVASELAVVVLIVIVNLLRQHNPLQGRHAALGLILGNLIGGLAAAVVYNLILLNDTFPFFVMVCLAATLAFAGRIATAGQRAPIYVIALATFILLLGLGMTPLPGGSGEAFVTRLVNVLWASAYAVGAVSVLEFWRIRPTHDVPVEPSAR